MIYLHTHKAIFSDLLLRQTDIQSRSNLNCYKIFKLTYDYTDYFRVIFTHKNSNKTLNYSDL